MALSNSKMNSVPFSKILIANRGEIALRIQRTCRTLGIRTVAIYTDGEENCQHVLQADEAECLGDGPLTATYLNIDRIIGIALRTGAKAIHPGYGFLSEQAAFAEACNKNGLVFIGPSADVLQLMGNKLRAKTIAAKAGVPVLENVLLRDGNKLPDPAGFRYPLLIKAAHGGGGKGMQIVREPEKLKEALDVASRAALNYFGNGEVFLETYLEQARHVEVQILGDRHGALLHVFERDCTVQRKHQKIVEEAPAIGIDAQVREQLHAAALAIGKAVSYENAGTVEFLVEPTGSFYFLEMNPRIQVEHPVSEQITGVDLVKEQIMIAAGEAISFKQDDLKINGHAIELRIYQEDPLYDFSPSTKALEQFVLPIHENLRIETDLYHGQAAASQFDPLLMKLIVHANDRDQAINKLQALLNETYLVGPATNLAYLQAVIKHPAFCENKLSTRFLELKHPELLGMMLGQQRGGFYPYVAAARMLQVTHHETSDSVWHEIGPIGISSSMTMEIDGEKIAMQWRKHSENYELLLNSVPYLVKMNQQDKNQLHLSLNGVEKAIRKISLKPGQTRWGVEGLLFEPFFDGFLEEYRETEKIHNQPDETDINHIVSHLHGKIETINIEVNQTVNKGDLLLTINAMKSENAVKAPRKAKIKQINVEVGDQVSDGMTLVLLEEIAL